MQKSKFLMAALAAAAIFHAAQVYADDESVPVYESLDDISVGRLFFSAAERRRIDSLRSGNELRDPVSRSVARAKARDSKAQDSAAGFIASASGKSRVYRDGDFHSGTADTDMRFPGDVKIIVKKVETITAPKTSSAEPNPDDPH